VEEIASRQRERLIVSHAQRWWRLEAETLRRAAIRPFHPNDGATKYRMIFQGCSNHREPGVRTKL
jgi:hypothetical protein